MMLCLLWQVKASNGLLRVSNKILLLEDDLLLCESLQDLLEEQNYEVDSARNGEEALSLAYENRYDLYLFDINVPLLNGLELLKELRLSDDETHAIYITSYNDKETLQHAFNSGADDYIKKPFDNDELLFRINAHLRRLHVEESVEYKTLSLNEKHKSATLDTRALELSAKEYALLKLLLQNSEKTVTKEMIISALWSPSESVSEGAIRVYINRIKSLIEPYKIENIRGIGYRLVS